MRHYKEFEIHQPEFLGKISVKNDKIFKIWKLFYLVRWEGGFWFRFFKGWGLHGKHMEKNLMLFTDRNHLEKRLIIGKWMFKILKPNN